MIYYTVILSTLYFNKVIANYSRLFTRVITLNNFSFLILPSSLYIVALPRRYVATGVGVGLVTSSISISSST